MTEEKPLNQENSDNTNIDTKELQQPDNVLSEVDATTTDKKETVVNPNETSVSDVVEVTQPEASESKEIIPTETSIKTNPFVKSETCIDISNNVGTYLLGGAQFKSEKSGVSGSIGLAYNYDGKHGVFLEGVATSPNIPKTEIAFENKLRTYLCEENVFKIDEKLYMKYSGNLGQGFGTYAFAGARANTSITDSNADKSVFQTSTKIGPYGLVGFSKKFNIKESQLSAYIETSYNPNYNTNSKAWNTNNVNFTIGLKYTF